MSKGRFFVFMSIINLVYIYSDEKYSKVTRTKNKQEQTLKMNVTRTISFLVVSEFRLIASVRWSFGYN